MGEIEEITEELKDTNVAEQLDAAKINGDSYQNLVEGKIELYVKNDKDDHLNICHILRDLYAKIYKLQSELLELSKLPPKN